MASISDSKRRDTRPADEDALLEAAVNDALRLCEKRSSPRFVGFLDERQRSVALAVLNRQKAGRCLFFGGYPEAERVMLGAFPDCGEPGAGAFPITALGFRYRSGSALSHRDFLGAMLSCGVKRVKVGDILCSDGFAVAFLETDIAGFLAGQITKIGGEGVAVLPEYQGKLPPAYSLREIQDTVASPRLDAVVKAAAGISRQEAARLIEMGHVAVNHLPCVSVSRDVKEKDCLSVRGTGRFIVDKLGPVSRKGRLFITLKKYQ